jgi:seryl-tRNA synthetase
VIAASVDVASDAGAFRDGLVQRGLLLPTAEAGVHVHGAEFEDTVYRVDRFVSRLGEADRPQVIRGGPVISRRLLERSGYLESFPHLAGSVHCFDGDETEHRRVLKAVQEGRDWSGALCATSVMLAPAACYHVYPLLAGTLPPAGRIVDIMAYCFRREPSDDLARMQTFRMHEQVCAGAAQDAAEWRARWIERALRLTVALSLDARLDSAVDPFFGRTGMLLATGQRDQQLKLEILTPVARIDQPTAIVSLNYHRDHFAARFGIQRADGTVAHTACVGFGLERIALALYRRHGFDRSAWPGSVREALEW